MSNTQINYQELFNTFDELTIQKISDIKNKMNNYVQNNITSYKKKYNLPLYLDYILQNVIKSFPILKNNADQLNKITLLINNIDKLNLHPYIYQSIMINIIHSVYVDTIKSNTDLANTDLANTNLANTDLADLNKVNTEITLLFEQFNNIFDEIDNKYFDREQLFGYNNINSMSDFEFNKLFSSIAMNISINQTLVNNCVKPNLLLNIFIVQIQRQSQILTEHKMKNSDNVLNINLNDLINNNQQKKLSIDTLLFEHIFKIYSESIEQSNLQINFFEIFDNIIIADITKRLNKFAIYFWIDYVSVINNSLFELLLKLKK